MDWREKVKAARLPEAVIQVVLRADLANEHETVSRELEAARAQKGTSLAGNGAAALEEKLREIEAEMRESAVEFRMRALPRRRRPGDRVLSWPELRAAHPPRDIDGETPLEDRLAGFVNMQSFPEALVRACVIDPDPTEAEWDDVLAALSDGQFDALVSAAWRLNQSKVDIPFLSAASVTTPNSGGA